METLDHNNKTLQEAAEDSVEESVMDLGTNLSSPRSQVSSELPTQPSSQNATQDPAKRLPGKIRAHERWLQESLWAEIRNYLIFFISHILRPLQTGMWDNQTAWEQPLYRGCSLPTLSLETSRWKYFLP